MIAFIGFILPLPLFAADKNEPGQNACISPEMLGENEVFLNLARFIDHKWFESGGVLLNEKFSNGGRRIRSLRGSQSLIDYLHQDIKFRWNSKAGHLVLNIPKTEYKFAVQVNNEGILYYSNQNKDVEYELYPVGDKSNIKIFVFSKEDQKWTPDSLFELHHKRTSLL